MDSDRTKRNAVPLAVPVACAWVIALASRLRFGGEALRHASPFPAPAWAWDAVIALLGVFIVLLLWISRGALSQADARRALVELAVYPLAFGVVWGWLPPYTEQYQTPDYALAGAVLLAFLFLLWCPPRGRPAWGITLRELRPALRDLALPTALLLVAGLIVAAATVGIAPRWQRMAVNVFTYPLSATVQLLLLQVLLIRRLQVLSQAHALIVLSAALLFGLVHWPNAPLALGCFLGAVVWARNFLRHENLLSIAISMGLLAAVLGNAVPREAIDNARTGPIYIQREIDAAAREGAATGKAPFQRGFVRRRLLPAPGPDRRVDP